MIIFSQLNNKFFKFSVLTCSFRGYPLQGKVVPVPEGYKGITFYEYKPPETEDAERNIYATGTFTQLTYWNYDKIPSRNDALIAALDWIDVAEAVSNLKAVIIYEKFQINNFQLHQPEDEPVDNN